MASIVTVGGKVCTKVRRAANNQDGGQQMSTSTSTTSTSSSTTTTEKSSTSTTKSIFAPTTNTPAASNLPIASVMIPPEPNTPPPPPPQQQTPPPQQQNPPPNNQPDPQPAPQPAPQAPPPQDQSSAAPVAAPQPQVTPPPQQNPPPAAAPAPQNQPAPAAAPAPNAGNAPTDANGGNGGANGGTGSNANSGNGGGLVGGSGSNAGGSNGGLNPANPPNALGSGSAASPLLNGGGVGSPVLQSAALGVEPVFFTGQGQANADGFTPIPVLVTSKGQTKTSFLTAPTGSSALGRGKGTATLGSNPLATGQSANGSNNGASGKASSTPIIAGVVTGFVCLALICGILFFCARKGKGIFRRRGDRPVVMQKTVSDRFSDFSDRVRYMFARKRGHSLSSGASQRSTTPTLERGMGRPSMAEVDSIPRIRSSSEPARRSMERMMERSMPESSAPMLPPLSLGSHRRSVSSVGGIAYPLLSDTNNPFLDPDPEAPLRIINPEMSRTQTPSAGINKGTMMAAAAVPIGAAVALSAPFVSKPPPISRHSRTQSNQLRNPFAESGDPFADPIEEEDERLESSNASKYSEPFDSSPTITSSSYSRHSRSQTLTGIPLITKTAPSSVASSRRHVHNNSTDSGFASADASPASISAARFGNNGLGIIQRTPSDSSDRTVLASPVAPRSVPGLPGTAINNPEFLSIPAAAAARANQAKRVSGASSTSSSMSLSFPSSWGSPGPTRPASVATQAAEPPRTAAGVPPTPYTPFTARSESRASDPFDLDVPEYLTYAASEYTRYSSVGGLSRQNSERSVRNNSANSNYSGSPTPRVPRNARPR